MFATLLVIFFNKLDLEKFFKIFSLIGSKYLLLLKNFLVVSMPNPISKFSGFLLSDKSFGILEFLIVKPNLRFFEISAFNFSTIVF